MDNQEVKLKKVQISLPEEVVRDFKATTAKNGTYMQKVGAQLIYEYLRKNGITYNDESNDKTE